MGVAQKPSRSKARRGNRPDALIVFFKVPEKGHVKTRLAQKYGDDEALYIYYVLMSYTIFNVRRYMDIAKNLETIMLYSSKKPKVAKEKGAVNGKYRFVAQVKGDMGQRFEAAFDDVLKGGPRKAIIIGTDCIGLTKEVLGAAFGALDKHDVVIGPAEDGGYYLIGFKDRSLANKLFKDVLWSTDKVLLQTMKNIKSAGLTVYKLPKLFDVDTPKDWARARKECAFVNVIYELAQHVEGGA